MVNSDESPNGQVELLARVNFRINMFYFTIDMLTAELKSRRKTHKMFYKIFNFLLKLHTRLMHSEHMYLTHAP